MHHLKRHWDSCGAQVRNNQVPNPRAMVEDILARASLLDAELARCSQHSSSAPAPAPAGAQPDAPGAVSGAPAVQAHERREQPPADESQQDMQLQPPSSTSQVRLWESPLTSSFFASRAHPLQVSCTMPKHPWALCTSTIHGSLEQNLQ